MKRRLVLILAVSVAAAPLAEGHLPPSFFASAYAHPQSPAPTYTPPVLPPLQTAADTAAAVQQGADVQAFATAATNLLLGHDKHLFDHDQRFSTDEAQAQTSTTSLQNQINALTQTVAALQAQVNALTTPAPASVNVNFTSFADGPLNGVQVNAGGIDFGTGFWCITNKELMACADNQPTRAWTFPRAVKLTNVTFSTTTANTNAVVLTVPNGGPKATCQDSAAIGADTGCSPGFAAPVTAATVTFLPSTGSAPDIRFRSITYQ